MYYGIMADKEFTERNVFRDQFPQAQILICIFHCMKSFYRKVTTKKMNITIGIKEISNNIYLF